MGMREGYFWNRQINYIGPMSTCESQTKINSWVLCQKPAKKKMHYTRFTLFRFDGSYRTTRALASKATCILLDFIDYRHRFNHRIELSESHLHLTRVTKTKMQYIKNTVSTVEALSFVDGLHQIIYAINREEVIFIRYLLLLSRHKFMSKIKYFWLSMP